MNKLIAAIAVLSTTYSLLVSADEQSSSTKIFNEFSELSSKSLDEQPNIFESPMVFIEQEFSQQLAQLKKSSLESDKSSGQWSVSFDLNTFDMQSADWSFDNTSNAVKTPLAYDWALGTSLVSPDRTSRFLVNYGERKVPISISFDDVTNGLSQNSFGIGLEQNLNESWAISISYLKTENELTSLVSDKNLSSIQEHSYSFDFSDTNRLETLNFSPFNHHLTQASFMDDISAISIKVSRKISDDIQISAEASQQNISFMEQMPSDLTFNPIQSNELSLQGQYELSDQWSLEADLERQKMSPFETSHLASGTNFEQLDSTTLDIGVQYQSNWDQVGVVIRIDLMNLLGVSNSDSGQQSIEQGALKPFSFDTPKYIKVSGSVSF